jgi:hypothetical protein
MSRESADISRDAAVMRRVSVDVEREKISGAGTEGLEASRASPEANWVLPRPDSVVLSRERKFWTGRGGCEVSAKIPTPDLSDLGRVAPDMRRIVMDRNRVVTDMERTRKSGSGTPSPYDSLRCHAQ